MLRSFTSPLVIRESKRGHPQLPSSTNSALLTLHRDPTQSNPLPADTTLTLSIDQMVLSSAAKESLQQIVRLFVMRETVLKGYSSALALQNQSGSSNLSLPNILIIGPPGTGKSLAATALAHSSGIPYLTLCGGDILGASPTLSSPGAISSTHSRGPGGLLRDVLDSARTANQGKGFLVILDEADALIKSSNRLRLPFSGGNAPQPPLSTSLEAVGEAVADCLHILLHRLKINSPSLGAIITTSMELETIDGAFLDRFRHLPLPR
jgi:hypothetical protein